MDCITKKAYISGKMTGLPKNEILSNFGKAESWVNSHGGSALNPAVFWYLQKPEGFSNEEYLHIDYAMIDVCDIIVALPNWRSSSGACKEIAYAKSKGKESFEINFLNSLETPCLVKISYDEPCLQ